MGRVSEAPDGEAPEVNIQIDGAMFGGVWANFAAVSHSPYEFTIDFVRIDFNAKQGKVVSRVNLSPLFVSQLLEALESNWSQYAARAMPKEVQGDDPSSQ